MRNNILAHQAYPKIYNKKTKPDPQDLKISKEIINYYHQLKKNICVKVNGLG